MNNRPVRTLSHTPILIILQTMTTSPLPDPLNRSLHRALGQQERRESFPMVLQQVIGEAVDGIQPLSNAAFLSQVPSR